MFGCPVIVMTALLMCVLVCGSIPMVIYPSPSRVRLFFTSHGLVATGPGWSLPTSSSPCGSFVIVHGWGCWLDLPSVLRRCASTGLSTRLLALCLPLPRASSSSCSRRAQNACPLGPSSSYSFCLALPFVFLISHISFLTDLSLQFLPLIIIAHL